MSALDKPTLERSRPRVSVIDFSVAELTDRLGDLLRGKVEQAWLFGSVPAGEAGPWSDLDLVLVTQSKRPFIERPLDFPELFELGVSVDLLVYTAEEFADLEQTSGGFWSGFRKSRLRIV
jgi:predicted nucleotidyltransferase